MSDKELRMHIAKALEVSGAAGAVIPAHKPVRGCGTNLGETHGTQPDTTPASELSSAQAHTHAKGRA